MVTLQKFTEFCGLGKPPCKPISQLHWILHSHHSPDCSHCKHRRPWFGTSGWWVGIKLSPPLWETMMASHSRWFTINKNGEFFHPKKGTFRASEVRSKAIEITWTNSTHLTGWTATYLPLFQIAKNWWMNHDKSPFLRPKYEMVGCLPMIKAHDSWFKKKLGTFKRNCHGSSNPGPAVHAAPYRPLRCYFRPPPPMTLGKCEKSMEIGALAFQGPTEITEKMPKAVLMGSTGEKKSDLLQCSTSIWETCPKNA